MTARQNGKRPAPFPTRPSKRRKLTSSSAKTPGYPKKYTIKPKDKGSEKAADRGVIPIPIRGDEDDIDLSDQDLEVLKAYGDTVSFLDNLDQKGISRSKKEIERLHQLNKPARQTIQNDDLPSVDSHDDDGESWDSDTGDSVLGSSDKERDEFEQEKFTLSTDDDTEMPYEKVPRKRRPSWEEDKTSKGVVQRLPIKLADGRVRQTGTIATAMPVSDDDDDDSEVEVSEDRDSAVPRFDDVSTGARFGRPAVVDVVGNSSRTTRLHNAKEQIANICQEIVADPENGLGLLRRLHTFSLKEITAPSHPEPVVNDPIIRQLAILSQLAVFKDIIPGYRIRPLTEKEKTEKVSQMVAQTRDWEQGLVLIYQSYLRSLESELKARSALAELAIQCMCTLLKEATHFNFRGNLMTCIVARLSKKSWDRSSDLCLNTLIKVFRDDLTGAASLEIVRLMNRMIKEKRYNIHPEVLSCLLHLRLKTELGVRASESSADDKKLHSRSKAASRRAKGKRTVQPHLSKKARKALKEKNEIDKEYREAEAEVDKEERAVTQTETLKLLFVLYFSILKNPRPTPLLPGALQGISKFAHLVNIDFFKDLMKVLKELMSRDQGISPQNEDNSPKDVQHRLLCIVTAFELLTGQGEALNIDLTDFISGLYALLPTLSFMADIDVAPPSPFSSDVRPVKTQSVADMLFRALSLVFSPRSFGATAPSVRSAAFAKRLLSASLHWPPPTVLRTLNFVKGLISKDRKLEALLSTEDRAFSGIYRPDLDDLQLCHPFGTSFWELHILRRDYYDAKVREEAGRLLNMVQM